MLDNPLIFKTMKHIYYILIAVAASLVSCLDTQSKRDDADKADVAHFEPGTRQLDVDFDIYSIATAEEFDKAIDRYWDGFDFECGERVAEYDTVQVMQVFADYVSYINVGAERVRRDSLLRGLMHRAEGSRPVLDFFAYVAEGVLHNPNSPLRNDELYIPEISNVKNTQELAADESIIQMQIPYSATVEIKNKLTALELSHYIVAKQPHNRYVCEFHSIEKFIALLLSLDADFFLVEPYWLRERLVRAAKRVLDNNFNRE